MGEEVINLSPIPRSEEKKIERDKEKKEEKGKKASDSLCPSCMGALFMVQNCHRHLNVKQNHIVDNIVP